MMRFNTTVELHDLGEFNEEWQGILSPLYDDGLTKKYIHAQFLRKASAYVENYQDLKYWRFLLKQAQTQLHFDSTHELKILDIGCGGGNTLFPLFELYPDASRRSRFVTCSETFYHNPDSKYKRSGRGCKPRPADLDFTDNTPGSSAD